jgi:hypothetical protein
MSADLQPVVLVAEMVRVVNRPGGKPQCLPLQSSKAGRRGSLMSVVPVSRPRKLASNSWRSKLADSIILFGRFRPLPLGSFNGGRAFRLSAARTARLRSSSEA